MAESCSNRLYKQELIVEYFEWDFVFDEIEKVGFALFYDYFNLG